MFPPYMFYLYSSFNYTLRGGFVQQADKAIRTSASLSEEGLQSKIARIASDKAGIRLFKLFDERGQGARVIEIDPSIAIEIEQSRVSLDHLATKIEGQ